jgi:ParB family chromosome partitioning protein
VKEAAMTVQMLDPRLLDVSENLREDIDQSSIPVLAESIRLVGIMQPILVRKRKDRYIVENGKRRTLAALMNGMTEVPAIVAEGDEPSERNSIQRQLIANCQQANLSDTDLARGIFRLMEQAKCSARDAAKLIGMSSKVGKILPLLKLPESVLELVEQGKIPSSCAYELSRVKDREKQLELATQLAEGKLTREALQRVIKSLLSPKPILVEKQRRTTVMLDRNRHVTVSAPGLDLTSMIECLDELIRKAKRERKRGVELDTFANMLRDQLSQEKDCNA